MHQDSTIGTVTYCGLGSLGIESDWDKIVHTWPEWDMALNTQPYLALRKRRAVLILPVCVCMVWYRMNFTLCGWNAHPCHKGLYEDCGEPAVQYHVVARWMCAFQGGRESCKHKLGANRPNQQLMRHMLHVWVHYWLWTVCGHVQNCQVRLVLHRVKVTGKGLPQQAKVAQGVPGSLRPRIFLTFDTTRVVGHQPYAPAAFTPGEIPGTHF